MPEQNHTSVTGANDGSAPASDRSPAQTRFPERFSALVAGDGVLPRQTVADAIAAERGPLRSMLARGTDAGTGRARARSAHDFFPVGPQLDVTPSRGDV